MLFLHKNNPSSCGDNGHLKGTLTHIELIGDDLDLIVTGNSSLNIWGKVMRIDDFSFQMSFVMRKPVFVICKQKGADQTSSFYIQNFKPHASFCS